MKNEFKEPVKEKKQKASKKARKPRGESRLGKALRSILDGSILTRENVVRLIPFVLFLTGISVFYIANSHYADKNIREANRLRKEINSLEAEFLSTESEKSTVNQQSELAVRLDSTGVKESVIPPTKIFVNGE
jgi:hypothetical protein